MRRHILVTDDDAEMRKWIDALLADAGYRVTTAADGLEAASYAATDHFDLLITDFAMPERNGVELIRSLRRHAPVARILLVSAYGEAEIRRAGLDDPDVTFLAKPLERESFLARVREILPPEDGF